MRTKKYHLALTDNEYSLIIKSLNDLRSDLITQVYFFCGAFGFNGKVQIPAPESMKELYRQMIAKADEDMQENE